MKRVRMAVGEAVLVGRPAFQAQRLFLEALFASTDSGPHVRHIRELAKIATRARSGPGTIEPDVRAWCTAHHLHDSWIVRAMQMHVEHWREFPTYKGRFVGLAQAFNMPDWPAGPSWNPIDTSEAEFRYAVEHYIRTVKKHSSYVASPVKDADSPDFARLVRYQVGEESASAIGGSYASKAVLKALRSTAAIIGLTLRPPERGRPIKSRKGTRQS